MSLILNKAKALKNNAVNDNLIINGNFEVWQRGLEFISTGYSADRWFFLENGDIRAYRKLANNLDNSNYCLGIETLSPDTSSFTIAQAVESEKITPLRSKYVSLSFYVRCPSSNNWSGNLVVVAKSSSSINNILNRSTIGGSTITITPTANDSWVKYSSSFLLPSDCTTLSIEFSPSSNLLAGSVIDIAQVKLENGNFITNFKSDPERDKHDTKRYYQKISAKLRAGTGAVSSQSRKFGTLVNLYQPLILNNPIVSVIEDNNVGLSNIDYFVTNSKGALEVSARANSPHSEIDVNLVIDSEIAFATIPSVPSGINILRSSSGVTVSWLSVTPYINETLNYVVKYGNSPTNLNNIFTTSNTSGFISGIYEYIPFYANVGATSFFGESESSEIVVSAPLFSIPSGVTGLTGIWGTDQGIDTFKISWEYITNDGGSPLKRYLIHVSNNSGFVSQPDYGYGVGSSGYTITQNPELNYRNISRLRNIEVSGNDPYYVRVAGTNSAGTGVFSSTFVLNKTVPSPIRNLSTLAINSGITLSYLPPSGNGGTNVSIVQVEHSSSSGFSAPVTKNYTPNYEPITISGLTNGVGRWFRMRAINPIGTGNWSNYVSGVPNRTLTIPNSPINLSSSWMATSGIRLSFNPPLDDGGSPIINYTANIATNSGFTTNSNTFTTLNNNPTIDIPTPIYTGTYYLRAKANNSLGSSSYSSGVSINSTTPDAPILSFASPLNSGVTLGWLEPIGRGSLINSYNIERSSSSTFSSVTTITGITGVLTYSVTGLTNNSALYFRVKGVNISGTGLASNILITTPQSPITVPNEPIITKFERISNSSGAILSWNSPINNGGSNVLSYNYQFSTGNLFSNILNSGSTTSLTFTLNSGVSDPMYARVRAINIQGTGNFSSTASVPKLLLAPGIPVNFSGVPSSGSFSLSWQAPTSSGNDTAPLNYNISSNKILDNSTVIGPSFNTTLTTGLLVVDSSGSQGPGKYQINIRSQNSLYYSNISSIIITNTSLIQKPTNFNVYYKAYEARGTLITSRIFNDQILLRANSSSQEQTFVFGQNILSLNSSSYGIAIRKTTSESYISIDFGSIVFVSTMYYRSKISGVITGLTYATNKTTQISNDNITWTTIGPTAVTSTATNNLVINKSCRYLRILNPTNNSWMSFSKIYFT
jgi:hypothetical protein